MTAVQPRDPNFVERVRGSFGRQAFMALLGAELTRLEPGFCEIRLPYRAELGQQHGYFHGGVVGTLADNVCGYSAFTLIGPDDSGLTVEYKLNLLAPADGDLLIARGTVAKAGRTLTVSRAEVFCRREGEERLCAAALATIMTLGSRPDGPA